MIKNWNKGSSKFLIENKIFKLREDRVISPKKESEHPVWVIDTPDWVNGDAQFRDMPISQKMTLEGTVNKTGILLLLCFATAAVSWNIPNPILMFTGMGVGFIAAIMGIGGAFLMVPAMIYLIGMPTKLVPGEQELLKERFKSAISWDNFIISFE